MNIKPWRSRHLVQWNKELCSDNPCLLVDKVVEAVMHQQGVLFEHTNEYRSVYSYDKLWEQLEHYDHRVVLDKANPYLRYGLQQADRLFSCPNKDMKLQPISLISAGAELLNLLSIKEDKSAGLTAYGMSKLEAFPIGLDKAVRILRDSKAPSPCLAGVRTQRKGKTRLVWGFPLEMTIIECIVMTPLINFRKERPGVMSFGDYSHETGMKMRKSITHNRSFVSLDFSQFDSTVSSLFQHAYYDSVRTWFNLDDEVYPGITVGRVIDVIEQYAINTPIVMPMRESEYPVVVTGIIGGEPSGSKSTQDCDSFTAVAMSFATARRFNFKLHDDDVYSLGDDLGWFLSLKLDAEGKLKLMNQIASFVSTFGFKINSMKSKIYDANETIEYLGRAWRNGFPIRKMKELTRGALYPENYRRYDRNNRAVRQKQALNIVASYGLTSYIDDPTCDVTLLNHLYNVSPWMSSGFTRYLLEEGLIPGDVLDRAIY